MKNKLRAILIFLASACFGAAAWAETGGYIIVTPSDIKWADVGSLPPGAKVAVIEGPMSEAVPITARLMLPANYKIPAHSHPGVERITVLSGTFNYGMGDKLDPQKTTALGAGSVIVMQPKMNHFVWTKEETVIQLNTMGPWTINYVNPADDPRKK
ncbi:MAG: cupin domain-containing protein [Oxalobacteraceae bacterium]|nr:cupin domain-containing protein [Oxalobacteraceae bacterium]